MLCPKCGTVVSNSEHFCPKCGASVGNPFDSNSAPTQQNQWQQRPAFPMNWYKFLIYFALFAGAVINLVNAIRFLTGMVNGSEYECKILYSVLPSWKTLDILMGLLLLGLVAFAIYTRFRLAGFYQNGPTCLYLVYGLAAAVNLIYLIGAAILVSDLGLSLGDLEISSTVAGIITSVVMIVINISYFKKRAALFNK